MAKFVELQHARDDIGSIFVNPDHVIAVRAAINTDEPTVIVELTSQNETFTNIHVKGTPSSIIADLQAVNG